MRVNWSWISVPLVAGFWGWMILSAFSTGDWFAGALRVSVAVAGIGVWLRKIWAKYLVYFLSAAGVLGVAYVILHEIITGRLFIGKGTIADDIGALPAAFLIIFSLAAFLLLCIGGSLIVHVHYKKMEQDRRAENLTGNASLPPSQSSDVQTGEASSPH